MGGSSLQIRLLGWLELTWNGEPCPLPSSPNVRSLLAYLVFHHDHPISRDRLAGIFWPERPDARARRALSQALWQMRSALGQVADHLTAESQDVTFELRAGDRLDVTEFEQLVDVADLWSLVAAVDLYRADFLEGIYDDWALLERERLRELYLGALGRLIVLHKQQGGYEQALAYAQRLVAADPLQEEAHCEVMRLYHLLGRSQEALEQFADLSDLMEKEMGTSPTPVTVTLYQEIAAMLEDAAAIPPYLPIAVPPPPLLHDLSHLPLVGRIEERTTLLSVLQPTAQGQASIALVEGDAGVGKSRLVDEIISDARWRGFQIGVAKAEHLTASAPYQSLRDALVPLLGPLRIAQLAEVVEPLWLSVVTAVFPVLAEQLPDLPTLASLEPHEEQRRLWEGVGRCLAGLAAVSPLLLVLEDLQWVDGATLTALPYLAPRLSSMRVSVILTARTAEARQRDAVWEALEAVDRSATMLRVGLRPFKRAETVSLVGRALGMEESDPHTIAFAERLQRETGGNTLFLVETLKALLEQGALVPLSAGGWCFPSTGEALPTPVSVHNLVAGRLARLDSALRATLEMVAVLGEDADFSVLARANDEAAVPPVALIPTLEALRKHGFLTETEAGYRFEHDRVREVVYEATTPERRLALHRRIGRALEAMRLERVELLAYHFWQGEVWDKAAGYSKQAGDRARMVYANAEAAAHYTQALAALERISTPIDSSFHFDLHLAREGIYDLQGERALQVEALDELQALAEQMGIVQQAEVALRRANYAEVIGDYPAAIAAARAAVGLAQAAGDVAGEATGYLLWGRILCHEEYEEARTRLGQALGLAQSIAQSPGQLGRLGKVEADSLRGIGNTYYFQGDYAKAKGYYERALHICCEIGDRRGECNTLNNLGVVSEHLANFAAADDYDSQALSICREIGHREGEGIVLASLGNVSLYLNRYDDAKAYYEQSLRIKQEINDRWGEGIVVNNLGLVFLFWGNYTRARTCFERSLSIFREIDDRWGEGQGLAYLGLLFHLLGDDKAALESSQKALIIGREIENKSHQGQALTFLGHALAGLGRLAEAAGAYREALSLRREVGQHNLAMEALAGMARVFLAQGDGARARSCAEEILDYVENNTLDGTDEPFHVYLTCYRALCACQDPRAEQVLLVAYNRLQTLAGGIEEQGLRRVFLQNVASHREIVATYREIQGDRVTVRLPRADAPTTRPLRDDEWVEVTWTHFAPEDSLIERKAAQRHHRLLRLLREAGEQSAAPTVDDLAAVLDVTSRTVKRDLAALRAAGYDVRTRGSH